MSPWLPGGMGHTGGASGGLGLGLGPCSAASPPGPWAFDLGVSLDPGGPGGCGTDEAPLPSGSPPPAACSGYSLLRLAVESGSSEMVLQALEWADARGHDWDVCAPGESKGCRVTAGVPAAAGLRVGVRMGAGPGAGAG